MGIADPHELSCEHSQVMNVRPCGAYVMLPEVTAFRREPLTKTSYKASNFFRTCMQAPMELAMGSD